MSTEIITPTQIIPANQIDYSEFSNEILEQVTNGALCGFNYDVINKHWDTIIGTKLLNENETIRLVIMPLKTSKMAQKSNIATGGWADKEQIRSADQLINRMIQVQGDEEPGAIGFALSAGIYNYEKDKSPGYQQLKYIQNMIIDVDAHTHADTTDRFNISTIKPDFIRYMATASLNYINQLLIHNGLPEIVPTYVAMTGGGFQFGVRFDKALFKEDGKKVFETFGSILGTTKLTKNDFDTGSKRLEDAKKALETNEGILLNSSLEVKEDEKRKTGKDVDEEILDPLFQSLKKKKGISVYVQSFSGDWFYPFLELDNSFKDVTHAQRVPGTINQKYNCFAYVDDNAINGDIVKVLIEKIKDLIKRNHIITEDEKRVQLNHYNNVVLILTNLVLVKNPTCSPTQQPTEYIKALSGIIQTANSNERIQGAGLINLTEMEREVLKKITDVRSFLRDHLNIEIVKDSSSYIACRSPFRQDNKPSLAVYINGGHVNVKDFTENKNYNLITLWMAVNDCSKSEALENIALQLGIEVSRSDKKDFLKIQSTENVLELISKIDTTNFVFYRLANQSKRCIWKNIRTSSTHVFDGHKMLANHVLSNHLKYKNADSTFKKEFQEAFENHILLEAFEKFEPGKDKILREDDDVTNINIWTASDTYLKCWEEAAHLDEMDIPAALKLVEEVCPNIYLYLLQITQKGDLEYFVNWLSCLTKFIYLPTIPIFPSIEGAGKNLFITEIIYPYVNGNYVETVNGQALQSNFNSFMDRVNLIVADEGNFTGSREFDQLKMLTGNDNVRVEKKGVDAVTVSRRFNMCMFTNGPDPVRHTITERRCVYFKLEHTLLRTLHKMDLTFEQFKNNIGQEVFKFWGIIIKTKLKKEWTNYNLKNGQFHHQILLMHPFGKLVIKMLNNEWDEISLQLNERQKESTEEKNNIHLLNTIKDAFYNGEPVPLILINKYLDAMSWKSTKSIQQFISENGLQDQGIRIVVESDSIRIRLDIEMLQKFIYQENNLSRLIPEFSVGKIKTLAELREENNVAKQNIQSRANNPIPTSRPLNSQAPGMPDFKNMPAPGMPAGAPPIPVGAPTVKMDLKAQALSAPIPESDLK